MYPKPYSIHLGGIIGFRSKLLKGGHIGEYIGDYFRAYSRGH